eukprot:5165962-Prymnesium_polylepis.1
MVAVGEVMLNESFNIFEGGSTTVSLKGASLNALPGSSPRLDDTPVSVESIDESASDSSASSYDSADSEEDLYAT